MRKYFTATIAAGVAVFGSLAVMTHAAAAVEFPCRTAKLIVPWKSGGGTQVIFAIFENAINKTGAKPSIQVVTIPGQGGNKGAKEAMKSKPDGCTLFAIHQSAITSYLNGRVDFTISAFDYVSLLTSTPDIIGANGKQPWNNMDDLLKAARSAPGTLLTGATFGSTSQFMWLLLEDKTGVKFKYVPYDGTRERMTALLSEAIQLGTINVASSRKYIESGELKAFGIADDKRSDQIPGLPTLKEQGIDMVFALNRGIVAPKGTPKEMIDHWAAVFKKAAEDPDLIKQMTAKGTDVKFVGPAGYAQWFDEVYGDYEKVAIKIGMYKK